MDLRVVNDHVIVFDARRLVFLGNVTEGVKEETVAKLHDIGLVDTCNFLGQR